MLHDEYDSTRQWVACSPGLEMKAQLSLVKGRSGVAVLYDEEFQATQRPVSPNRPRRFTRDTAEAPRQEASPPSPALQAPAASVMVDEFRGSLPLSHGGTNSLAWTPAKVRRLCAAWEHPVIYRREAQSTS